MTLRRLSALKREYVAIVEPVSLGFLAGTADLLFQQPHWPESRRKVL
jgi:hypothetical protein